jgi:hypothetical protein
MLFGFLLIIFGRQGPEKGMFSFFAVFIKTEREDRLWC